MRNVFSTRHSTGTDVALLIARVAIAAMMLVHGLPKMEMLLSGAALQFPPVMGMSPETSLTLAVLAEVLGSLLLLLGLGTRLASIPLIVTMLVAAFAIHGGDPFARQEPSLLYLLVYVVLLLTGAGRFSVDRLLFGQNGKAIRVGQKKNARAYAAGVGSRG